jgi:ABC-type dipeptide/oligopeptide/nickel transport system ATPase component
VATTDYVAFMPGNAESLLEIEGLTLDFDVGRPTEHRALNGLSLSVGLSEVVGLVGESGSGKTVLAHSTLGILPKNGHVTSGRVLWQGRELLGLQEPAMRQVRGRQIAMVFQDAQASLNPVFTIQTQFHWLLKLHRKMTIDQSHSESCRLLQAVQLSDTSRILDSYPHQLSGGMCQRVMIALAIACEPKLIITDEPTSALDRIVQSEIVELLESIHRETGMSMLIITHDLGMARRLASRIAVIQAGTIVEENVTQCIFEMPKSPYTRRLLAAANLTPLNRVDLATN